MKRILSLCLVVMLLLSPTAFVFADEAEIPVVRIAGQNRYETSVLVSKAAFSTSKVAVVASGASFPDALVGGVLAGHMNAPLLVTPKDNVSDALLSELSRLGVETIYLLGGTGTVTAEVEQKLAQSYQVTRLSGDNRIMTSKAVAMHLGDDPTIEVKNRLYVDGRNYPDALAGAPMVVNQQGVMLLADGHDVVGEWIAIGGENSVPGTPTKRIAGSNRYETAVKVANEYTNRPTTVVLVDGSNYPDALSASGYANEKNALVLLTSPKKLSAETKAYLKTQDVEQVIVIGGANSVSDAVVEEVKNAKKPPVVTPPLPVVPDPVDPKPVVPTPPTPSLPSDSAACYATGLPKGGLKDSPYPDRLIKGNINSKSERIYHMVGMRDYNKTWIDECVGEKWFATEAEAKAAGWRKAQQ